MSRKKFQSPTPPFSQKISILFIKSWTFHFFIFLTQSILNTNIL